MSAPVHFEVEVLYQTTWGPACGNGARGRLTEEPAKVTCPVCRELLGMAQLTEVQSDPLRRAA